MYIYLMVEGTSEQVFDEHEYLRALAKLDLPDYQSMDRGLLLVGGSADDKVWLVKKGPEPGMLCGSHGNP